MTKRNTIRNIILALFVVVLAFGLNKSQAMAEHKYGFLNESTQTTGTVRYSADYYGKTVEGYTIYWNEGPYTDWNNYNVVYTNDNYYTFKGLKPGTLYAVNVQATLVDENGNKEYNMRVAHGNFVTLPAQIKNVTVEPATNGKSAKVSWTGMHDVDYEYEVSNLAGKKIKSLSGVVESNGVLVTKTKVNIKGLDPSKGYLVRIRAKVGLNGKTEYGAWSAYSSILPKINLKKAKLVNGVAKLQWSSAKEYTDFYVYASTSKRSGFKSVAHVKKGATKASFAKLGGKKLEVGKKYYVYVLGKKKAGGKTYSVKSDVLKLSK